MATFRSFLVLTFFSLLTLSSHSQPSSLRNHTADWFENIAWTQPIGKPVGDVVVLLSKQDFQCEPLAPSQLRCIHLSDPSKQVMVSYNDRRLVQQLRTE